MHHICLFKVAAASSYYIDQTDQTKALNGIQWEVAHPLTLNYKAPIPSRDATICVSSEGTPYIVITKGFKFVKFLCLLYLCM